MVLLGFIEQRPGVGIFASFTGLFTSLLHVMHVTTDFIAWGGAVFGCLAGYYTWRIQRHKWQRESVKPVSNPTTPSPHSKTKH